MLRTIFVSLVTGLGLLSAAATPALAQTAPTADRLEQIAQQLQELKEQNERLQAEVEYLKSNALAARKDAASETVKVDALVSTATVAASKYTWTGDFRMRRELIDAEENVGRARDRMRLRFGVLAKVNDTINARIQISTTNSGNDNARSTNQTLGTGFDRKPLSIDLAYVDWEATDTLNLVLGKQPIPWTTTVSYLFDKDITPEGAALKWVRGPIFGGLYYSDLNERDAGALSATSSAASTDANMLAAQLGIKKQVGRFIWTGAVGYFDVNNVRDRVVSGAGGCTIDGAFGSGQGTGNNAFGNTTYSAAAPIVGSTAVCTRLLNDFNLIEALGQLDFTIGRYPFSAFVDYMKNNGVSSSISNKQDTALAAGFLFNKAAAARTWELGVVYQKTEKDAMFAQLHDSDFGGGNTDNKGYVLKATYVPLINWTLNAQYMINDRFIDPNDTVLTRSYKRLQLDLNYKY